MARGAYPAPQFTEAELLHEMRERLAYDAARGEFRRLPGFRGVAAGQLLGCPDSTGKLQATFCGSLYMVDALVWLWETGELPSEGLKHINGDNGDSRFCNLAPSRPLSTAARAEKFEKSISARFGGTVSLDPASYSSMAAKATFRCAKHGAFRRSPQDVIGSRWGCPSCGRELATRAGRPSKKSEAEKRETRRARWRRENAGRRAYKIAYNEANAGRIKLVQSAYLKRRRSTPEGKAESICRHSLTRVIKAAKIPRVARRDVMLGYSSEDLRAHIEAMFEPWMTWANHGAEWHVDHVKPVVAFLKEGVTDPSVINALSNLQPMRKADNQRKGARWAPGYSA